MLNEVLEARFDEVLARWQQRVSTSIAPEVMPVVELLDHMPRFVRELIALLQDGGPQPVQNSAANHGGERLRLGFSLEGVVREYGMLREAIMATAVEANYRPTLAESERIANAVIEGIAVAVAEYAHQRDAELMRQHNEHIAFLAHELRNPLSTAIFAQSNLPAIEGKAAAALSRALASMQGVIDSALRLAQFGAGIELNRTPVMLGGLLDEVIGGSESDAAGARISIVTELVDGDVELRVDQRLVRSALDNMLRNAVKYSHDGGRVVVRGKLAGDRVIIEVEDSCGGLPAGAMEAMFVPFVRLTSAKSGFGLGLAIAKQAIDAHSGTIRVENLPGRGCMFVIDLPRGT
jgi:signal transduction histidine kinase